MPRELEKPTVPHGEELTQTAQSTKLKIGNQCMHCSAQEQGCVEQFIPAALKVQRPLLAQSRSAQILSFQETIRSSNCSNFVFYFAQIVLLSNNIISFHSSSLKLQIHYIPCNAVETRAEKGIIA